MRRSDSRSCIRAQSDDYLESLATDLQATAGDTVTTPWKGLTAVSDEEFLDPDEVAENYWHLGEQDRSAWTLELDLRPHVEEF